MWTHREVQRASDSQRTQQGKENMRNTWGHRGPTEYIDKGVDDTENQTCKRKAWTMKDKVENMHLRRWEC